MNDKSSLGFLVSAGSLIIALTLLSCTPSVEPSKETADDTSLSPPVSLPAASTIAGEAVAKESRLRSIPAARIVAARTGLHVAYQHTSHGTHVSYGLFGLPSYKTGDDILFAITNNASTPVADRLDFKDYAISAGAPDLSQADGNWSAWLLSNRTYLDDPANSAINVVMWSWCSINGHNVAGYLSSMQNLIDEYGQGGSKIGTGTGKTRTTPVTFIFMTGHAEAGDNVGNGNPCDQAKLITDYCSAHGYYCLDYYSIDSHDMAGNYWEDASDDARSVAAGDRNYNADWQGSHSLGTDWFENKSSPGGSASFGEHLSQHITANRKAYAMWYLLARIAGWDGNSSD